MLGKWSSNGAVVGLFEHDNEVYDLSFSEHTWKGNLCVFLYDYKMCPS